MQYWRDKAFGVLRDAAAEAAKIPAWTDYADYCDQLHRGLRQPALAAMERFLLKIDSAPFEERRRFVSWLMHQTELSLARELRSS